MSKTPQTMDSLQVMRLLRWLVLSRCWSWKPSQSCASAVVNNNCTHEEREVHFLVGAKRPAREATFVGSHCHGRLLTSEMGGSCWWLK